MLQSRNGKRTAKAAVRIAVEMANEGLITQEEAVRRVDPARSISCSTRRSIPSARGKLLASGLPASPGAAAGKIVFNADEAERRAGQAGRKVILVRVETSPEDIHGMKAARGHPHRARRHDQPRRRGRARHGQALRRRRAAALRVDYAAQHDDGRAA